jgi:hypothetical protein
MAVLATAGVALAIITALPGLRAAAQHLWNRLFLTAVTVVRVDPDQLPWSLNIHVGQSTPVKAYNLEEAARFVGFTPNLPLFLHGNPELAIFGPVTATLDLKTSELRKALETAGADNDVRVPDAWNGQRLRIEISPFLIAKWEDDTTLMQLRPIALKTPASVVVSEFVEISFRILGLGSWEARSLSERFAAHPTWFLGVPQDQLARIREVNLGSGTGMLIEDFSEGTNQLERTAVIWSTPDRTFILSGNLSADQAVAIANSVHR